MTIDNFDELFDIIRPFDDCIYFVQIIARRKDGCKIKKNEKIIKQFLVKDWNKLNEKREEIITLCESFSARAYINPTPKSLPKINFELVRRYLGAAESKQLIDPYRTVASVIAGIKTSPRKLWVIDYDYDLKNQYLNIEIQKINPNGFRRTIPTPNGHHIICAPFNVKAFKEASTTPQAANKGMKNNSTLLYFKPI